jgi:hypothetical protein
MGCELARPVKASSAMNNVSRQGVWAALGILIAGLSVSLMVSATATAFRGHRVYFAQSQEPSSTVYRPHSLDVAGEGSFIVRHVHWRSWNGRAAHGRGIGGVDDCNPNCGAGTFHRAPSGSLSASLGASAATSFTRVPPSTGLDRNRQESLAAGTGAWLASHVEAWPSGVCGRASRVARGQPFRVERSSAGSSSSNRATR